MQARVEALKPYFLAVTLALTIAIFGVPLREYLDSIDVVLVLLVVVALIALWFESGPSIAASIAAFLAFNFLYTQPYYTLSVERTADVLSLFVFLGLAVLISQLLVRVRRRTREALQRGRQTETLYRLSVALIRDSDLESTLQAIVERVFEVFDLTACVILLQDGERLDATARTGQQLDVEDRNLQRVARWAIEERVPVGIGTRRVRVRYSGQLPQRNALPFEVLLVPILTAEQPLGVLVVARERGQQPFDDEESRLLATFANQAAVAIERSMLEDQRARAEQLSREDELKTALLSAVSHDLRTPLASIKAAVTTLLQPNVAISDADRRELLEAIDEESDRLNRLVANLLDLSRIESGALKAVREWYPLEQLVLEAVERSELMLGERDVRLEMPPELVIDVDYLMIAEVLANLLENAAKYSPSGAPIAITARRINGMAEVRVIDAGEGVPRGEEQRIFDKFYRVEARNRPIGSGMGLAISKGFVEAHGGRIWVERNADVGSAFIFTVPTVAPSEIASDVDLSMQVESGQR